MRYLKFFLKYCTDDLEIFNGKNFRKWKVPEWRAREIITVTPKELDQLSTHQYKSEKLEKARDLFIFQCYTGLRYSDVKKLKDENIDWESGRLTLRQQKTNELINAVPIHAAAMNILSKYRKHPEILPIISNQKYNDYLKEAAKLAGLTRKVIINTTAGGKYKEFTKFLYELLTTHKGRSSFISNLKDHGVDSDDIRQFTGHTDRTNRALNRYDKKSNTRLSNALDKLI